MLRFVTFIIFFALGAASLLLLTQQQTHHDERSCTKVLVGRFEYSNDMHTHEFTLEHKDYVRDSLHSLRCGLNIVLVNGDDSRAIQVRKELNFGKVPDWFTRAYKESDADLIFKMDADVSMCSQEASRVLVGIAKKGYDYVGYPAYIRCGNNTKMWHPRCIEWDERFTMYMQGGFYGLSRRVLQVLHEKHATRLQVFSRSEDVDAGRWVSDLEPKVFFINCLMGDSWCFAYHWFRQGVDWSARGRSTRSWCSLKRAPMYQIRNTQCWKPCINAKRINANALWSRVGVLNTTTRSMGEVRNATGTYSFPVGPRACRHAMRCSVKKVEGFRCRSRVQSGSNVYEHIKC